jgi:hypothetical protein
MTPQEKQEYMLNQVIDSTSKILALLSPMAERFMKRRDWDSSGPDSDRPVGNMTR